jgi:hypothetical protein
MDLIRGANPYPDDLPSLPIDPVMRRLREAGPLQPAARRRIPRPNTGGVMVLVTVVIALAIAVVAITAGSPGHRTSVAQRPPVSSSRQELLRTIGVLRRPQTKADLSVTRLADGLLPGILQGGSTRDACDQEPNSAPLRCKVDTPLVRAVNVGDGYRAAIFPVKIEHSTPQVQRGEGVVLALNGPRFDDLASIAPTSVQTLRDRGLLLSAYFGSDVDRGVMLVPDGVAKIALDHFRLLAPHAARLDHIPSTTATVTDNLALLQITGVTEQNLHLEPQTLRPYFIEGSGPDGCRMTSAVYSFPATAQMTWLGRGHTTIRRTTTKLQLNIGIHDPAAGTVPYPPRC